MARRGRNEGSVTFLKSRKVWVASVFEGMGPDGKPIYRKAQRKTKAAATAALNEMKVEAASGRPVVKGRMTVGEWLDHWMDHHVKPNRSAKTLRSYDQVVRIHLKPKLGRVELKKLDPSTIARFFADKRVEFAKARKELEETKAKNPKTKRQPVQGEATLRNTRAVLRAALNQAVATGRMSYCPVNEANGLGRIQRKSTQVLTPKHLADLHLAVAGSPVERLVRFVMATGLRVGEATGLRWRDVDIKAGMFRVENQLQRVDGKLAVRPLKTEMSRRNLPLTGIALEAVKEEQSRQMLDGSDCEEDFVFLNSELRPFDQKNVDKYLKAALVKVKLPVTGMHSLRHAAATAMLQNGTPIHTVSRFLGHSSITLTANTYGHVLSEAHQGAAETLDAAIRSHMQDEKGQPRE